MSVSAGFPKKVGARCGIDIYARLLISSVFRDYPFLAAIKILYQARRFHHTILVIQNKVRNNLA